MDTDRQGVAIDDEGVEIAVHIDVRNRDLHRIVSACVFHAGAERAVPGCERRHPTSVPRMRGEQVEPGVSRHVSRHHVDRAAQVSRKHDIAAVGERSVSLVAEQRDSSVVGVGLGAGAGIENVEILILVHVSQLDVGVEVSCPLLFLGAVVHRRREAAVPVVENDRELEQVARDHEIRMTVPVQIARAEIGRADAHTEEHGREEPAGAVVLEDRDLRSLAVIAVSCNGGVQVGVAVEVCCHDLGGTAHRREDQMRRECFSIEVLQEGNGASLVVRARVRREDVGSPVSREVGNFDAHGRGADEQVDGWKVTRFPVMEDDRDVVRIPVIGCNQVFEPIAIQIRHSRSVWIEPFRIGAHRERPRRFEEPVVRSSIRARGKL